jgi:DNA-binding NtrC family response regulator
MLDFAALVGKYILVLDDERDVVRVIAKSLRNQGINVREFTDPAAALEDFKQNFRDCALILSDIRMPAMSGFQFVRMAREVKPDVRVVFMTAFEISISEFEKIHPSMKAYDLLKKPVLMRKLEALIRNSMAVTATATKSKELAGSQALKKDLMSS